MTKNTRLMPLFLLCSLYGCASTPIAVQPPVPKSPEMLQPAPAPGLFSLCLREILSGLTSGPLCQRLLQEPTK